MTTPIYDFIMEYAKTHPVRPHMPGHKGRPPFDSSYLKNLYAMDITEIEGADSLFEANGIIKKSEENATSLFKTAGTFYSCGGSTLCIQAMLFLLGMFLETLATLIILVPVLLPVVIHVGVDPIHFGIILVVSNEIALLTPPLGVNLFVSSRIANIPVEKVAVGVLPYIIVLLFCSLLITFVPQISLFLPHFFGYF